MKGDNIQVVISGVPRPALGALATENPARGASAVWLDAPSFFNMLDVPAAGEPHARLVWLYRAPWAISANQVSSGSSDVQNLLEEWLVQQRIVLKARRHNPNLLIVNVDHVPWPVLAREIDLNQGAGDMPLAHCRGEHDLLVTVFAQLFDRNLPEYWEVFEALESIAWLPSGEPLFRSSLGPSTPAAVWNIAQALHDSRQRSCAETAAAQREKDMLALQLRQSQKELQSLREEFANCTAQLEQQSNDARQQQALLEDEREENELLLLQLHQVQEELEHYYLENEKLRAASRAGNDEATNTGALALDGSELPEGPNANNTVSPTTTGRRWVRFIPPPVLRRLRRLREDRRLRDMVREVDESGLFDREWYLAAYEDVRTSGIDPIEHYLTHGWKEVRNPGPQFDTRQYLLSYPDLKREQIIPLIHYIRFGRAEGRVPI